MCGYKPIYCIQFWVRIISLSVNVLLVWLHKQHCFVPRTSFAETMGLHLKPGRVVIVGVDDCGIPAFFEIKEIFRTATVLLGLERIKVVEYSPHFHSWMIVKEDVPEKKLLDVNLLFTRQCLCPRSLPSVPNRYKFITLKHAF